MVGEEIVIKYSVNNANKSKTKNQKDSHKKITTEQGSQHTTGRKEGIKREGRNKTGRKERPKEITKEIRR